MNKVKKIIIGILLIVGVLAVLIMIADSRIKPTVTDTGGIILFYGDSCPHCKIVEQYISDNKIEEKIQFERKEVYKNTSNAEALADKAKICNIPDNQIGVPFLWDGTTCLMGNDDIVKFFKDKTDAQK